MFDAGDTASVIIPELEKSDKGLCIPLSEDLATLLKVEEGTPVSLTFRKKCVELRSVNYTVGESRFDNIQGAGDILTRFGRHFGGPSGTEVYIAEKEYLCLFDKSKVVALMKYIHAANDWLAGYDAVYRKMQGPDLDELRENKMFSPSCNTTLYCDKIRVMPHHFNKKKPPM